MNTIYDIAIIGAGAVGSAIARELSRYELNIVLLEAHPDVGMGTSKASTRRRLDPRGARQLLRRRARRAEAAQPAVSGSAQPAVTGSGTSSSTDASPGTPIRSGKP